MPDPANPQSLNRYSYVLNNPLKYTDASGHRELEDVDQPNDGPPPPPQEPPTEPPRQRHEPRLPLERKGTIEPNRPTVAPNVGTSSDQLKLTVIWGYGDEGPTDPVGLTSYYHSVIVGVDEQGRYYRVETWGGSAMLGGALRWEWYEPGESITAYDGRWVPSLGIYVPFIAAEPMIQVDTDKPYLEVVSHLFVGVGCEFGFALRRTMVKEVTYEHTHDDMPRWVANKLGF